MIPLATVILDQAPSIIAALKNAFTTANPGAPEPTDAEVLAQLHSWAAASIAEDERIKAEQS